MYVDKVLPFGLQYSRRCTAMDNGKRRSLLADTLPRQFITIGSSYNEECAKIKAIMFEVCEKVGLPVEPEKDEGPATTLVFLGLELDSVALLVRLPHPSVEVSVVGLEREKGRGTYCP